MATEAKRSPSTEDILRKVRGLIAKANSSEFDAERETFMKAADNMMEKYAIEMWMLEQSANAGKTKLITKKVFDMEWWSDLGNLHFDAKSYVWWLFEACVRHTRCYTSWSTISYQRNEDGKTDRKITVYGLSSDLGYLDMLFTDLFIQLFSKIRPQYDPKKSLGENVMVAKEAGMKYRDVCIWLGHPEWVDSAGKVIPTHGRQILKAYKEHLATLGKTPEDMVTVHPDAYAISYTREFYGAISSRLLALRKESLESSGDNSMALAVRDIRDQAQEALWEDYPNLRPHPADCSCKACVAARKPVKYRGGHQYIAAAGKAGHQAGSEARIVSNDPKLRTPGKLDK
jgi:hypothetical protein